MMRNDAEALCGLCYGHSSVMAQLRRDGADKDTLSRLASGLVIDAELSCTTKLTAADVGKDPKACDGKCTLLALRDAVNAHSSNPEFLVPAEVVKGLQDVVLVDPSSADIQSLESSLAGLDVARSSDCDKQPITKFFSESTVGLKMVQHAESVRQSRKHELVTEAGVSNVEEQGRTLKASNPFCNEEHYITNALNSEAILQFEKACEEILSDVSKKKKCAMRSVWTSRI